MQLVEQNLLQLDDPVSSYLRAYLQKLPSNHYLNTHGKHITIRMLLNHTSGVPNPIPLVSWCASMQLLVLCRWSQISVLLIHLTGLVLYWRNYYIVVACWKEARSIFQCTPAVSQVEIKTWDEILVLQCWILVTGKGYWTCNEEILWWNIRRADCTSVRIGWE